MAREKWKQTFKRDGLIYKQAGVYVYLSGTKTAARVFSAATGGTAITSLPQLSTDADGMVEFWLDPDDHPTGQLFDVECVPRAGCSTYATAETIKFYNLQILQDTEGARSFKQVFAQDEPPTEGMRKDDLFFDTDDNNHPYVYSGSAWVSARDGSIATAGTTATWANITGAGKPDDNADVTGSNTALGVTRLDGSELRSGYTSTINGTLLIENGALVLDFDGCDLEFKEGSTKYGDISAGSGSGGFLTIRSLAGGSLFLDSDDDLQLTADVDVRITAETGDITLASGSGEININNMINYGTVTSIGSKTVTGYITIKDGGGATQYLAVVS